MATTGREPASFFSAGFKCPSVTILEEITNMCTTVCSGSQMADWKLQQSAVSSGA